MGWRVEKARRTRAPGGVRSGPGSVDGGGRRGGAQGLQVRVERLGAGVRVCPRGQGGERRHCWVGGGIGGNLRFCFCPHTWEAMLTPCGSRAGGWIQVWSLNSRDVACGLSLENRRDCLGRQQTQERWARTGVLRGEAWEGRALVGGGTGVGCPERKRVSPGSLSAVPHMAAGGRTKALIRPPCSQSCPVIPARKSEPFAWDAGGPLTGHPANLSDVLQPTSQCPHLPARTRPQDVPCISHLPACAPGGLLSSGPGQLLLTLHTSPLWSFPARVALQHSCPRLRGCAVNVALLPWVLVVYWNVLFPLPSC